VYIAILDDPFVLCELIGGLRVDNWRHDVHGHMPHMHISHRRSTFFLGGKLGPVTAKEPPTRLKKFTFKRSGLDCKQPPTTAESSESSRMEKKFT